MLWLALAYLAAAAPAWAASGALVPYSPPCTARENVFAFAEPPAVRLAGPDRYEISFASKGRCDATVAIVDDKDVVVRHLASGVLGANAPAPFRKDALRQVITWDGKDDLGEYHRTPEKLRARVMLGLKPVFDKRLGGSSPYRMPGQPFGIAAAESGIYVFSAGSGPRLYVRKFDHDGNYVESLVPPPSRHPESKLQGLSYVEYEPGRRAVHARNLYDTLAGWGHTFLNLNTGRDFIAGNQPVVVGDRLFYANSGINGPSFLHYVYTDGSTDIAGTSGMPLQPAARPVHKSVTFPHPFPHFAASPDGRFLYYVSSTPGIWGPEAKSETVWRKDLQQPEKPAEPLVGVAGEPGSDNAHLSYPSGIACDGEGQIYVADLRNNRLQVFSAEGRPTATIPVDRPRAVAVHRKTGAVYVLHTATVRGVSVGQLTKFAAWNTPQPVLSVAETATFLAVDSWSAAPRIWLAGAGEDPKAASFALYAGDLDFEKSAFSGGGDSVRVFEDQGTALKPFLHFAARAREDDGPQVGVLPFSGDMTGRKVFCDPVREQAYIGREQKFIGHNVVFDLRTGQALRSVRFPGTDLHAAMDDLAFDKKGLLHVHFDPGFYMPGIGRVNPDQAVPAQPGRAPSAGVPVVRLTEVPYDYGIDAGAWKGILPCRGQPGACFYQSGIGVNMRGDVAAQANIYYAPKMEAEAEALLLGPKPEGAGSRNRGLGNGGASYAALLREIEAKAKLGEETYFIKRAPGLPAAGPTVWTFAASGQLLQECAVIMNHVIIGVHIDEDRNLYFASNAARAVAGKRFLDGHYGRFGEPYVIGDPVWLQSGILARCGPGGARIRIAAAPIRLDVPPDRPPDVFADMKGPAWVEGAEWLYAGVTPCVTAAAICTCPKQNFHLDWFRRSYVPEAYRHSIGVLDANGNLILHLGRFGNFDDAAKMREGGDVIVTFNRYLSGTDNYLVYEDFGERVVVLKLTYHAEAAVPIGSR